MRGVRATGIAARGRWRHLPGNTRGALWILLAALIMTLQVAVVKKLGAGLHIFEIVFFRCAFSFLILSPAFPRLGLGAYATARPALHITRSVLGILAMACYFYAVSWLPLAEAIAYTFTMPLFMILCAVLLLGERVRWRRWTATAVGFAGVLVMLRPGMVAVEAAALVALFGALLSALVFTSVKKLSATESALTMILYFALVGMLMSIGPAIAVWRWPNGAEFALLALIGALGTAGQYVAVWGWSVGEATAVAPFDYSRLIFAAALGFVLFAEVPDPMTILGAGIIVASTLYIGRRAARVEAPTQVGRTLPQ